MELIDEVKELLIKTANELKGSARRLFMARTVRALGKGGQRRAEKALGWNHGLIRKGEHELKSGMMCIDALQEVETRLQRWPSLEKWFVDIPFSRVPISGLDS